MRKQVSVWLLSVVLLFSLCSGCVKPVVEAVSPVVKDVVGEEITTDAGEPEILDAVSAAPLPTESVRGHLRKAEEFQIALETLDGILYTFQVDEMPEAKVGSPVHLTYEGVLDASLEVQNATVLEIAGDEKSKGTRIKELLSVLTLKQKVHQLFLVRVPQKDAHKVAEQYQFGGYMLFERDFEGKSAKKVRDTIKSYQDVSQIPMLIAVDEEGGTVNRVSNQKKLRKAPFASPRTLYRQGGEEAVVAGSIARAQFLKGFGINVNLGPVCDVPAKVMDYIYPRALGTKATTTASIIGAEIEAVEKEVGMGTVLKHFPGYGNNRDTHGSSTVDKRAYSTFENRDFLPFQAGINAGADAVLVSHIVVNAMDEDAPASLSKEVHRVLREELDFDGVIMTDDLYMDAVQEYADAGESAVLAIQAGNDLLCSTDYAEQSKAVLEAVEDGSISEKRIEQSVRRILRWKMNLGILD